MRKLALLLVLALIPAQAWALNIKDLLSTIAMPLAVAALTNSGVPQTQLADLVTTLNQANVPPTQFVEVIRYVPVAMVDQNGQPFVAYVQEQTSQGVTGDALVNAIVNRLQSNYNITPVLDLNGEPTTVVMSDNYIPPDVLTQLPANPLSAIALPLAVAAVSDINGVPQDALANLVATLDNANIAPAQEIQIIRYAPVALIADNGQPFVQYVQQQVTNGVTGPALVPVVVQQLQTYYPPQTQIAVVPQPAPLAPAPVAQPVVVERQYAPPPVAVARVRAYQMNPHGGPPGQMKRQLGYQTGAEVVHGGERPGRPMMPMPAPMISSAPPPHPVPHGHGRGAAVAHGHGHPMPAPMMSSAPPRPVPAPVAVPAAPPQRIPPGQMMRPHGGPPAGGPPGHGKGHGHGKD